MIVIVFRARFKEGVDTEELARLGSRMYTLASAMPGFVSYKDFESEDGESVSIVEFESLETLAAWRAHPEHRAVQHRARETLMSQYHIQVCDTIRDYAFKAQS
ncbi:heme-degrading monooxygenase HmoA [Pseudomonas sp. 3296]|jgi:heme-degrading monooxygenase HmoA|uniref:antibiotic biosynthesis monooxygenase family protein n=1 Tax=Pseudomonas sp. 3296 TaxID=2817753 RepID=UPI0028562399|nr:antibiotic biosynthesis monooxygenase [Pseudomonas sp. 3296]MDR6919142.1 heme-degrading monooxygenase HmoA [Pseudomonas sp. 3296]